MEWLAIPLRTQEQRSSGLAPVHKLFVPPMAACLEV